MASTVQYVDAVCPPQNQGMADRGLAQPGVERSNVAAGTSGLLNVEKDSRLSPPEVRKCCRTRYSAGSVYYVYYIVYYILLNSLSAWPCPRNKPSDYLGNYQSR